MFKYPRTQHIEGSRLQVGDADLSQVRFESLASEYLVLEEKIDGANAGVGFDSGGGLRLQSRGHYLTGGAREKHFALFKTWAAAHKQALFEVLSDRYVMYGEWVFAKHTVFYDRLPHYFLEFDILDTQTNRFLDTETRHKLLEDSPVVSVPVLETGIGSDLAPPKTHVRSSLYKSGSWRETLRELALELCLDPARISRETDASDLAEGIYIKVEKDGIVTNRLKWVRHTFLTTVVASESHWLNRPIIPNQLASKVDIFKG